ncbi:MAG: hypothetical protein QMB98_02835 [Flaviflexus sp.]|uniref:hypothetical protein n=1 Tax=Flaviflexus sp. TaxID=1969482 RepID=UPI00352C1EDD
MEKNSPSHELSDSRRTAHGTARLLLLFIAAASLVFAWLGVVGATTAFMEDRPGTAVLTLIAAITWIAMSAGLLHNGRRMRRVAWISALINVVMPLIGIFVSLPLDKWSPWRDGGLAYWYVPTVLAVVAMVWLYNSSPARLAQQNG